ncbi:flagellar basal body P-ring formation chaperone FlgA [Legionella worsleiensis]|uniref:Flagella basal body P-ring formation protein FlgA n=1 Tax=Legionella worsleiensis TaxID=45076 RepID=A0A0W1A4A1_9GAMM|nr:flagellar basal body P-ring formation chaperone FlgA [Legionella worsleiensis]KTD76032.1 flagellar basal body P-ring biosynthesis protein FlgA [Legionella worsleiensis]STY33046.1 flagella basal body P-ring formation protein FlgA [Legionella worsleiensis]
MKTSILSVLTFFASFCLNAEQIQSLDLIKHKIESYVLNDLTGYAEGKIQVQADQLDSRLNLRACADERLEIFNPYQTPLLHTTTMGIKCMEEDNHWTLYVPIKVSVLKTVLVAKRALVKGSRINNDDIYSLEMDAQKLKHGYFTNKKELLGLICKQDISPDSPLNNFNIELAKLVHRGDHVTIFATNDLLTVSMSGVAVDEGVLGDSIRVKNLSSKRVIEARITGEKKVTVVL